jgi:octaprenyl-diphosphate synthase
LFDYSEEAIGKPTGIDIKEQKMTLPLYMFWILVLKGKSWIINSINHNKDKKGKRSYCFVKDNNGLAYAESKMVEFQQEALLLDNYSNSDFKEALILMVNYVIERKNRRLSFKTL